MLLTEQMQPRPVSEMELGINSISESLTSITMIASCRASLFLFSLADVYYCLSCLLKAWFGPVLNKHHIAI